MVFSERGSGAVCGRFPILFAYILEIDITHMWQSDSHDHASLDVSHTKGRASVLLARVAVNMTTIFAFLLFLVPI
jgi:hypothetical protein